MTIPFFNLHSHTGFSINDGLYYPKEHFDFVVENGGEGMAITEHGHCNSYVYALNAQKDITKKGNKFRYVPGCEFYIHPSLSEWGKEYTASKEKNKVILNEDETATIENEEETKSKQKNPLKKRNHLVVLAKTPKGLQNLFTLVSMGYKDGFYKYPRIDYDLLRKYGEDLVVSSACCGGNLSADVWEEFPGVEFDALRPELLTPEKLKNILSRAENTLDKVVSAVGEENCFIELQFNKLTAQHLANKCFLELAKKTGIKLITTADSHYPRPEMWRDRELYKKIGWLQFNNFKTDKLPDDISELKAELYPKNGEQMWDAYKSTTKGYDFYNDDVVLESIKRTHNIAFDLIKDPKPDTSVKLPPWSAKTNDPLQELTDLSFAGLKERGFDKEQVYVDRLNEELGLIHEKGLENYFLTMRDIIRLVENDVIVGHGRGSASGSLVCFCLRITNIDPIKFKLLFSRFINKQRKGMPDIDTDFSDRGKVIDILKKNYGEDNIINISNTNTFKIKSIVKDVSKFFGIPFTEANEALKTFDFDVARNSKAEEGDKNPNPTYEQALRWSPPLKKYIDAHPEITEHLDVLLKQIKTIGTHAGGCIICDDILTRMPCIRSKDKIQTPWSESGTITHLEQMGWIKFDLLGVETLATIEDCISIILKTREGIDKPTFKHIKEWYVKNLDPNVLDLGDQKVYKNVYHDGNFLGIFQFTEHPVQHFVKEVKPTSIADISSITAIFRPGPLNGKVNKVFLDNKNNQNLQYEHPKIKQVLEETYNCLVFQEQAMALANVVGNIPLDECDDVRRLISKKPEKGTEMEKKVLVLEEKFISGAETNGIKKEIAKDLWDKMIMFSQYSFNNCLAKDTLVETRSGMKEIQNVKVGEEVNSMNGFLKVKNVFQNGKKQLFKIKTDGGKTLTCTLDHKLQTTHYGMKPMEFVASELGDLKENFIVTKDGNEEVVFCFSMPDDETFDLEVEHEDHTFFANDISVSNSHSTSYRILSYQCAWLLTHFEDCWVSAFLNHEPDDKKEQAIGLAKSAGYEIVPADINASGMSWMPQGKKLLQPLSSIKGLGDKALEQVFANRPFTNIENFLFNENILYNKLNKKGIDVLCRSGALSSLKDERFVNDKHFWVSIVGLDKPKNEKALTQNIEAFKDEKDFSVVEKIQNIVELTGLFPIEQVIKKETLDKLSQKNIPSISVLDKNESGDGGVCWFVVGGWEIKEAKNKKKYAVLSVIDSGGKITKVKCWSPSGIENFATYRPYLCKVKQDTWGFSVKSLSELKLLS